MLNLEIYNDLNEFRQKRLFWSKCGPKLGAINLCKMSNKLKSIVSESNIILIKGCRSHEMTQGGLPCVTYTAYVVARSFSEVISGYDATESPLLLFKLEPYEYSFFGFASRKKIPIIMRDGREVHPVFSTIKEHFERKQLMDANEIVVELKCVLRTLDKFKPNDAKAAISEANMLAEKLIEITRKTYDATAEQYDALRHEEPHEMDKRLWCDLMGYTKMQIDSGLLKANPQNINLLDLGTGNGRDLKYSQQDLKIKSVGVDNSDIFIAKVKELESKKIIDRGSIVKADFREMPMFSNGSFDILRHNASLLHIPITAKGFMADKALEECHRILKPGGILYVLVKKGNGLGVTDTGEGLGQRIFQYYTQELLKNILERNKFKIIEIRTEVELRNNTEIHWLVAFATKKI